ncbi:MAG: hypothetical protein ACK41C_03945 [Phenylobacterium sp.]|jgi:hypothetical protein|uniref:hypothetical protein n=1 Tax=Phenylobacterium sp. TaxID=1871053 RepID=UPI00391A4D3D
MSGGFIGWEVDREDRARLLERFPAAYAETVADHVTLKFGLEAKPQLPHETEGRIVGFADDGGGVQAAVVEIEGTTDRPDGGVYHITWSLAEGRAAKESNDVIAERGWTPVEPQALVRLRPRRWP